MNSVYSFVSIQFWFFALVFFLATYIVCFLAGKLVLNRAPVKSEGAFHFFLANVIGLVLWSLQGYVFGYAHLRWLSYVYVVGVLYLSRKDILQTIKRGITPVLRNILSFDRVIVGCIVVGAILQALPVFGSGAMYPDGIRFYKNNAYDGVMHLSYVESIVRTFPPREPGSYILPLKNYHYFGDLFIAELTRIWRIPISHIFFQYITIYISVLTGIGLYLLVKEWGGKTSTIRWALFFLYGAGELTYLFILFFHRIVEFNTPALDNGIDQFLNLPHTFGKLIFFAGLLTLWNWKKSRKNVWLMLTVLLFAPVIGFKVYFGLFAGIGLGLVLLDYLVRKYLQVVRAYGIFSAIWRIIIKEKIVILCGFGYLFITLAIYLPTNATSGGFFYAPMEWPKIFLGAQNIDWNAWWLRSAVYQDAKNLRGIIAMNTIAIGIFLLCMHGTRLLGVLVLPKLQKALGREGALFFIPGTVIFTIIGLTTLQVSGMFNVFNFFVVTSVPLAISAAFFLDALWSSKWRILQFTAILIVLFTLPRVVNDMYETIVMYGTKEFYYTIPRGELEAFRYIDQHAPKDAIVQSHPENPLDKYTQYSSFFVNRMTYITGAGNLETHNEPFKEQQQEVNKIFYAPFTSQMFEQMREKGISYIFFQKHNPAQKLPFDAKDLDTNMVRPFFENDSILVLERVQ